MIEPSGLPPDDLRIDELCSRYESAWRTGRPIHLTTLLDDSGLSSTAQARLFRELLLLEIELRESSGDQPNPVDYRDRFPDFAREVDAAFTWIAVEGRRPVEGDGSPVEATTLNRYEVVATIAQGGLGLVSEVRDLVLDREMAMKEVRPDRDNPDARSRLAREARVNGILEHPGIVPVYGLGSHDDGRPFYVMRLVQGETLALAVERFHELGLNPEPGRRRPALEDLLHRFASVCDAIGYAHSKGVIHRDIKPSNVMLGRFGETLVVDWGLARSSREPGRRAEPPGTTADPDGFQTSQGQVLGTPHYMSPEQAVGDPDAVGPSSDIYSLGATLYDILAGRPPFGDSAATDEILARLATGDFAPPTRVRPSCPRPLEAVCLKAMAPRREDRYTSAVALADDVRRWIAGEAVTARRESWAERLWRWATRHRTLVASIASVAMVGLVVGLPLAWLASVAEAEARAVDQGRVAALLDARVEALPGLLQAIRVNPSRVVPLLNDLFRSGRLEPDQERNLALALDPADSAVRDVLLARLGDDKNFETLPITCQAFSRADPKPIVAELWRQLETPRRIEPDAAETRPIEIVGPDRRSFRIAAAIARLDPPLTDVERRRWAPFADLIADGSVETVIASPSDFRRVLDTFRPIRRTLDGPFAARFRDIAPDRFEPARATRRTIVGAFLDDYADTPAAVAGLIPDTLPGPRLGRFLDRLRAWGDLGTSALRTVSDRLDDPTPLLGAPVEPGLLAEFRARRRSRVISALEELGQLISK